MASVNVRLDGGPPLAIAGAWDDRSSMRWEVHLPYGEPLSLATQNYRPLANPLFVPDLVPGAHELSLELLGATAGDKFKLYAVLSC